MQDISLQNFLTDINNVKEYIKHIDLTNKLEAATRNSNEASLKIFNEHLHSFGKSKRIFEYKAIIISLYGIIEKYIGIWIQEHIDTLPNIIQNYNDLPSTLRKNNFDLSIKLISLVNENRFVKYEHLTKEDLLLRLSDCISKPSEYKLNSDAFSPSSGNLKHSKISEAFKYLDIELQTKLKLNKQFSIFLKQKFGNNISNRGDDLFTIIDDLVIRRNEIAHGADIDNILNITEFDNYIEFLENYGKAIFETIVEKELEYETQFLRTEIANIKGVFKQGSILCFEIENHKIKTGDYIIIKTPDNTFIKKQILEIQKDNKVFEQLDIDSKTDIGVNLGSGITKNQNFYI